uniref:Guanine nucleotide-binding protein subunit gamma n=2 Tax=Oryctolagus cuniculus TaxID=9986 RepID=G1SRT3_RABIT
MHEQAYMCENDLAPAEYRVNVQVLLLVVVAGYRTSASGLTLPGAEKVFQTKACSSLCLLQQNTHFFWPGRARSAAQASKCSLAWTEKLQVVRGGGGPGRVLCPPWERSACNCAALVSSRGSSMKEGMSSNSTTSISQARKAVEQLKMEACMDRVKVSQAAADLLAYCEAHVREDPLISPVPASENPFREKKFFCTIL